MRRKRLLRLSVLLAGITHTMAFAPAARTQAAPPRIFSWIETVQSEEGLAIRSPVAVTAISERELVVAEATPEPRVLRLRRSGGAWALEGVVPLPAAPVDLVYDGKRLVVALRQPAGLVSLEGSDRAVRRLPVSREIVPGRIAVASNGLLLVQDLAHDRIVELDGSGKVARQTDLPPGVTALAAVSNGGFVIALAAESRVVRYDEQWREEDSWSLAGDDSKPAWPVALDVAPDGEILVLDRHTGRILALDSNGRWIGFGSRQGWEPGLLWFPADLANVSEGLVVVADQGNGRVQLFRQVGKGGGE